MQDLLAAWRAVEHHPVGILLPAAAQMAIAVLAAGAVRPLLGPEWRTWLAALSIARLAALVAQVPFRGSMLVAGATALGSPAAGMRVGPLLAVVAVEAAATGIALLAISGPALAVAVAILGSGWIATGLMFGGVGVFAAEVAALAVAALLAGAPIEVVVGGRGGLGALSASLRQARWAFLPRFGFLLAGRAAVVVGGLACGAGALPGYPIADLAVMNHWLRRRAAGG